MNLKKKLHNFGIPFLRNEQMVSLGCLMGENSSTILTRIREGKLHQFMKTRYAQKNYKVLVAITQIKR